VNGEIGLYASGGVHVGVTVQLLAADGAAAPVSICFGKERVTLELYGPESLERLRDLADQGAHLSAR
jgi:hypothetical protein